MDYLGYIIAAASIVIFLWIWLREKAKFKNKWKGEAEEEFQKEFKSEVAKLGEIRHEIEEKQTFNESLHKIRKEELDRTLQLEEEKERARIQYEIEEWAKSAQEAASNKFRMDEEEYTDALEVYEGIISRYKESEAHWREISQAVNEQIRRLTMEEEERDFYRIQLDEDAKADIELINSIREKIKKPDLLNKLLYTNYVDKPVKEMIKRVLGSRNPSGIYKVTNIRTKQAYIGKSTTIATRWQNHVKSACGLEGVADSMFQRALKKEGVDAFSWEILEETAKENLTTREKYYINLFDTKSVGYNMREG